MGFLWVKDKDILNCTVKNFFQKAQLFSVDKDNSGYQNIYKVSATLWISIKNNFITDCYSMILMNLFNNNLNSIYSIIDYFWVVKSSKINILPPPKKSNWIEIFKNFLYSIIRHVYIFNSQEPHWCSTNLCNGLETYVLDHNLGAKNFTEACENLARIYARTSREY